MDDHLNKTEPQYVFNLEKDHVLIKLMSSKINALAATGINTGIRKHLDEE